MVTKNQDMVLFIVEIRFYVTNFYIDIRENVNLNDHSFSSITPVDILHGLDVVY